MPAKLLGPRSACRQKCPARAAALRARVDGEHTDPGLAALQKLPRRPRKRPGQR